MIYFGGWCRTVISLGNGLDSHSLAQIHSLQVALCLVPEEWPKVGNGLGSAIRDRHSLGRTHSLQVALCLVPKEWPRVGNGPGSEIKRVILPCLRRIVQIAHHWCSNFWGKMIFQISQMWVEEWPRWFSLYHNIVSVQVDIRWLLWRLYVSRQ